MATAVLLQLAAGVTATKLSWLVVARAEIIGVGPSEMSDTGRLRAVCAAGFPEPA